MSALELDTTAPVLVTGATGYVAGWLIKRLLEAGFTVHAAVRNPENTEKLQYLNAIAAQSPGSIHYFQSDLLNPGSYGAAMEGCRVVFHTASPFKMSVEDPENDLIKPAQMGTRNVLEQANQIASVQRVVVTSSCAAIYGDSIDSDERRGGPLTEDDWNKTSSLEHQPYSYSKTVAEHEAWKIAQTQSRWELVIINPSLVIGPGINPFATSASFSLVQQLGDGTMKSGTVEFCLATVDVREVAEAHMQAGFNPSAQGRHIISGHSTSMAEMAQILRQAFGDSYPFPKRTIPKTLMWLVAPFLGQSMSRKVVARNIGIPLQLNNHKSKQKLGITYRPLNQSLTEMFQQLIDNGMVSAQ